MIDVTQTKEAIIEALKVVYDPEIPVNIVDLGLVYDVEVADSGAVEIEMTLTSMGCPAMGLIQSNVEMAAAQVDGVAGVNVEFDSSPPWRPGSMTEDGKKQIRMFGFNI